MDAHSPHSRCTPTRYALLNGRYCWRTRLKHWVLFGVHGDPLIERDRTTLPEFLKSAGYATGMVGKWHLGLTYRNAKGEPAVGWNDADLTKPLADGPLDHGFDYFHGMSRSHGTSGPGSRKNPNGPKQKRGPGWLHGRKVAGATGNGKKLDGSYKLNEVGKVLDEHAHAFLGKAVADKKPFFLYFASPSNHSPYTPSDKIGDTAVAGQSRTVDGKATNSKRLDFIHENDVLIARLLDYLEKTDDPRRPGRRLLENTLFMFSSDNGSENPAKRFTGPLRSNKGSTYEGGHRVPFIASWPLGGVGDGKDDTPGENCSRLLALTDIYATVAEAVGRPLPPLKGKGRGAEDSFSQLAAMRGRIFGSRPPIFPNDHKEASKKLADARAWTAVRSNAAPIAGQWKLFLDESFAFKGKINAKELYNLATDPKEEKNLLADPKAKPALDFLVEQAKAAAGADGATRSAAR